MIERSHYQVVGMLKLVESLATKLFLVRNSVATFARQASTGRIAFSRVSGSIYFEPEAPPRGDRSGEHA
jgi:hypothetical protein